MSALREVLISLGVEIEDKKLDSFDKKISTVLNSLEQFAGALLVGKVAKAMVSFVEAQIEVGAHLDDLAQRLGVGSDELQQFQYAGQMAGVEAESMAASMGKLNKNIGEALQGGESAKVFAKLGVSLKDASGNARPLEDVTLDLSDAIQGMHSQSERAAVVMELFGKSGAQLLPLFKDGSKGVAEMFAEFKRLGGGMDKDFIAKAAAADDSMVRLKFVFQGLKSTIASAILPAFKGVIDKLTTWAVKGREFLRTTNVLQVGLIGLGVAGFAAILKIAKAMRMLMGGQMGLVIAAVGILFLLFEDLYTLMTGGESVIGETLDKLFGAGAAAQFADQLRAAWDQCVQAFNTALPAIDSLFTLLGPVAKGALMSTLNLFVWFIKIIASAVTLINGLVQAISAMVDAFKSVRSKVGAGNGFMDALFGRSGALGSLLAPEGKAGQAIDKAGDTVFGTNGAGLGFFGGQGDGILQLPKPAAPFNMAARPNVSQTNHVEIEINGATDPVKVGKEVKKGVSEGVSFRNAGEASDSW